MAIELLNMKKRLRGEEPDNISIPDYLTKNLALSVYEQSLHKTSVIMQDVITQKRKELDMDKEKFLPLLNTDKDIMVDINNRYYPKISKAHLQLYRKNNITPLELQTALHKYSINDEEFVTKLNLITNLHKKEYNKIFFIVYNILCRIFNHSVSLIHQQFHYY